MKVYNQPVELIVDARVVSSKSKTPFNLKKQLADAGIQVEVIEKRAARLPAGKTTQSKAFPVAPSEKLYVKTKIKDSEMNPWDIAHTASRTTGFNFVEPDVLQEFVVDSNIDAAYKRKNAKGKGILKKSSDEGYDPDWQPHRNLIWHLGDAFSQLKSAREAVADIDYTVRIGHIDTGYNPTHSALPESARKNKLQRNFVDNEPPLDAHDPYVDGTLRMPGHGTGTLGLLAGSKIKINTDDGVFNDFLGGAPFAEIVCCRISTSVILFKTSAFAEAVNYLVGLTRSGIPVHAVSMSMGGAPAKIWADAVNAAYDAGIVLVTASGNNFNGLPTQHVVYPARFGRVIAACGVTHDLKPYHSTKAAEMEGCYGPERHMINALSAFTPNTPWASGNKSTIKFSGAGTSSATPQVAAAAAIYYRKYHAQLDQLQPWQRVEAIRNALYRSASKKANPIGTFKNCFGNGIVKAMDALAVPVQAINQKTPEDTVPWFPVLTTIFKAMPGKAPSTKMTMFNTELAQLVFYYPDLANIIDNDKKSFDKVSKKQWKQFADAVIEHPAASLALKRFLMSTHS